MIRAAFFFQIDDIAHGMLSIESQNIY